MVSLHSYDVSLTGYVGKLQGCLTTAHNIITIIISTTATSATTITAMLLLLL